MNSKMMQVVTCDMIIRMQLLSHDQMDESQPTVAVQLGLKGLRFFFTLLLS